MSRIILASASPRRKALLAALGITFDVITSNAEEIDHGSTPSDIVQTNACTKRDDVAKTVDGPAVIIAADTLVFLDQHVLGKPADANEARSMLRRLSGKTHQVVTGLAIADTTIGASIEGAETTDVTFRELTDAEIDRFVEIVNPIDRAGAYTVDGPGSLIVSRYDGCYQNVLGLPIVKLDNLLRQIGIKLFERMDADNATFL